MNILHVIPSLSPLRGGPSVMAHAIAAAQARTGITVHVATTDDDGPGRAALPLGQPVCADGVTYWYFARQTRFYTASWPLARWLQRNVRRYDLVHVHALFSFAPLAAAAIAAQQGVPYVVRPLGTLNRWGMQRRRPLLKRLSFVLCERRALARAAAIHFTSAQEQREASALGELGRGVIIPNPVSLEAERVARLAGQFRAQHPWLAQRTIVLFLSRLDPKKGLDLLLPAFAAAQAQQPALALVIAGTGDSAFAAGLRAAAARLGVADHTLWAGQLDGDARLAALADADLFALPSYSENFGNAAVEALACGVPAVLSDQVGVQHEVAAAGAGLVVPCQVAPLNAALLRLANDPALRQAMGERGRRLVRERYTPAAVAARLTELYESIVGADRNTAIITPVRPRARPKVVS